MKYVIANDKLGPRVYMAGGVQLGMTWGMVIAPTIFNADTFDTKKEANRVLKNCTGEGWEIFEITP